MFDDIPLEIPRAKKGVDGGGGRGNAVNTNVELDFLDIKLSFYIGSSEYEKGEVKSRRRPRTRDHYDPNTEALHICVGMFLITGLSLRRLWHNS